MKIKEFTYTKANGDVSKRTIVELVSPASHIEGVDISDLDMDTFADFVKEFNALENEAAAKRTEFYARFDLKHNYRRFVVERMTDVTTDYS